MWPFKKIITIIVFFLIAILAIIAFLPKWEAYRMEQRGSKIIETIEKFKVQHGRLPESLGEIGLIDDMHTQPFYSKRSENEYELHYSWDFDRGYGYFSKTGKWRDTY